MGANCFEEIGRAGLPTLEDEFEPVKRRILRPGAAERSSGLDTCCPGQSVEVKLLERVRGRVSATQHNTARPDQCKEITQKVTQRSAQCISARHARRSTESGVEDDVVVISKARRCGIPNPL